MELSIRKESTPVVIVPTAFSTGKYIQYIVMDIKEDTLCKGRSVVGIKIGRRGQKISLNDTHPRRQKNASNFSRRIY